MRIAVLGATGRTGGVVVEQALERGHDVVALVRSPDTLSPSIRDRTEVRRADVTEPGSFPHLDDVDRVISTIGIAKNDGPGALTAGATILGRAGVPTIWLGALGSGVSADAGGLIYKSVMRMFVGSELAEKAQADTIAVDAGATVFHAPDVSNGPLSPTRHIVALGDLRRPVLPPRISRASLAALLLDEAKSGDHTGIVVPLS